jgi:hypothetical protein
MSGATLFLFFAVMDWSQGAVRPFGPASGPFMRSHEYVLTGFSFKDQCARSPLTLICFVDRRLSLIA